MYLEEKELVGIQSSQSGTAPVRMTTNQKSASVIIALIVSEVVRGDQQVLALGSKDFPGMLCNYKKEHVGQGRLTRI